MEDGIELGQYIKVLRKRWRLLVTLPLLAAFISGLISFFVLEPIYQASTTLIVGRKATDSSQMAGQMLDYNVLRANQELAKTYVEIAGSRTVEQKALADLNLSLKVNELDNMISVKPIPNTEILEIQVTNSSPDLAASIANTLAEEFSQAVMDIKKVDSVSIIDKAEQPEKPISPRKLLNVLIAFAVGLIAAGGLALLLEALDNTVKSSEEVESLLGIPVLGIIPQG